MVDVIGLGRPPVHQQILGVPVAVLGPEHRAANLADGQHDMRVMVPLVNFTPRGVKRDVSNPPAGDELGLNEPARKIALLFRRQIGRRGHPHVAAVAEALRRYASL